MPDHPPRPKSEVELMHEPPAVPDTYVVSTATLQGVGGTLPTRPQPPPEPGPTIAGGSWFGPDDKP